MKNINWLATLATAAMIIIFIKLGSSINKLKLDLTLITDENKQITQKNELNIRAIEQLFIDNYVYGYIPLSNDDILIVEDKNHLLKLSEIVGDRGKIVYNIPENVCDICYDEVIKVLKSYSDMIGKENIIILVPTERIRELKSYLQELKYEIPYFGVNDNNFLSERDAYSPFFFYLDEEMVVSHIFTPSKSETESTQYFLRIIVDKFF